MMSQLKNHLGVGFVFVTILTLMLSACGQSESQNPHQKTEIDLPDEIKAKLETGAPSSYYGFYVLKEKAQTLTSSQIEEDGLLIICAQCPPLVPYRLSSFVCGFTTGTGEQGTQGIQVYESPYNADQAMNDSGLNDSGLDFTFPIGGSISSRIKWAVEEKMPESSGLILLTERSAISEFDDKLTEISFK
jgi:hypothetical protein